MAQGKRWTTEESTELLAIVERITGRGDDKVVAFEAAAAMLGRTIGAIRNQHSMLTKPVKDKVEVVEVVEVEPAVEPVKEEPKAELHKAILTVNYHLTVLENENKGLKVLSEDLRKENAELEQRWKKAEADATLLLSNINRGRNEVEAEPQLTYNKDTRRMLRGEVWMMEGLGYTSGSEQRGERPVLIIQNDVGNSHSPNVIVAAITSSRNKKDLVTHVPVMRMGGMDKDSVIMLEQILTISKERLKKRIAVLPFSDMKRVNNKILISLGIHI